MASKNEVTITFAGDTAQLEKASDRVADSLRHVDKSAHEAGTGFDRVGEAADNVDTKAMGFRDTMTGVQDSMKGASQIAKGDLFTGFLTLGMGIGDLGSGLYNFLVPSLKSATAWLRTTRVATIAHAVVSRASATASRVWAAAQWVLNAALTANPIGLVVVAVALLVAAFVIAYRRSETFRRIVQAALNGVRVAAQAVAHWFAGPFVSFFVTGWNKVTGFFQRAKGTVIAVFRSIGDAISAPFRAAFGAVRSAWNSTVGGFGFTVPNWIPGVGGKGFHIPRMHTGGTVPGIPGSEILTILQAGEQILPPGRGGATVQVNFVGSTPRGKWLAYEIHKAVRDKDIQLAVVNGRVVVGAL